MTSLQRICEEMEDFSSTVFRTSEQHVDTRNSRMFMDNDDMKKLLEWVYQHVPFRETSNLISVTSGVVGDERINCHMAQEVGITSISRIIN